MHITGHNKNVELPRGGVGWGMHPIDRIKSAQVWAGCGNKSPVILHRANIFLYLSTPPHLQPLQKSYIQRKGGGIYYVVLHPGLL